LLDLCCSGCFFAVQLAFVVLVLVHDAALLVINQQVRVDHIFHEALFVLKLLASTQDIETTERLDGLLRLYRRLA
jgi:hypothetical protein